MHDYEVRGGYTNGADSGTFTGIFRIFSDNRFVGTMEDNGADIVYNKDNKTKLVLGTLEDSQLNFWKLSSNHLCSPLVYVMRGDGEHYRGNWIPISMSVIASLNEGDNELPEIEEAFKSNKLEEILSILGKIEKSRLQPYLYPDFIKDISHFSKETGYLTLHKFQAFSA